MQEIKTDIIKEFKYKKYLVYIILRDNNFEYYLQHKDYGIISLFYGMSKDSVDIDTFIKMIKATIKDDIIAYKELYED